MKSYVGLEEMLRRQSFKNNTKSRGVLSEVHETLPISRAPHVAPRVSSSNENRRILPRGT